MRSTTPPTVSVLVISDYGGRTAEEWSYLRDTLAALSGQDCDERVETILVDATPAGETMPAELLDIVPGIRVIGGAEEPASTLLNRAAEATSGEFVALLDGDCAPVPGWLRAGLDALRADPRAAAVSGLTVYPGAGFRDRALGLLSRSFVDPGSAGPTRFMTSNNAILRRHALLAHPLGNHRRAMAARLQAEAIRMDGGTLLFEPRMRVRHRFDGWPMERRIRRHVGYRAVRVRQLDPRLPFTWMIRFGYLSIPLVLAARIADSWRDCLRARHHYGIRPLELPLAFALAVAVHLMEIGGMIEAFSEASPPGPRALGAAAPTSSLGDEARQ